MGNRRRKRQGRVSTAAVLAVLFLIIGGKACLEEKQVENEDGGQWDSWQQRCEQVLLQEAVGFLAPGLGYVWQWQEETAGDPPVQLSIQQLVLQEQKQMVFGTPEVLDGEQTGVSVPEDMVELEVDITERDEDLLAEIDRENEMIRQQAALLQSQQADDRQALSLPYTKEQLSSLEYLKEYLYNVSRSTSVTADLLDVDALLSMDMALEHPDSGGPKVLIHHTHATEYFSDSNAKDETTLIVGVGDYLEELLETRYGIQVIHDRTVYPYNEAYSRALKHVESILAENPTIEVFIDLHRDAGGTKKYTVNVEGKEMAHLMFFNGLSHSANGPIDYLPNDNQQANLAFSFQMKLAGDSLYPGLCKRNYLKAYRYNLHVLPRAVIVEVGDNNNTLQEAKNAMEPLARILYLILMGGE